MYCPSVVDLDKPGGDKISPTRKRTSLKRNTSKEVMKKAISQPYGKELPNIININTFKE